MTTFCEWIETRISMDMSASFWNKFNSDKRGSLKKIFISCFISAVFLLAGCSPVETSVFPVATRVDGILSSALQIQELGFSVSGEAGNSNLQVVSYNLNLHNPGPNPVALKWLEPVLKDPISRRALDKDLRVIVNQTIAPNSTLAVSGKFTFDSKGLTKVDIASWNSFFSGVTFSSEQTIPLQPGG